MSVVVLLVVVLLFVFISITQKDNLFKRMLFFFNGYWGIELIFSSIGVADFYKPSGFAVFLLLANLLMFTLGFCAFNNNTFKSPSSSEVHSLINELIDSKVFTLLLIIATLLSVRYFVIMRSVFAYTGEMEAVRRAYYDHSMFGRAFLWQDHLFLEPMRYICVPLFGYMLFFRKNWKLIFVILFLLCYSSLGAGRLGFLRLVLGVFFIIFCVFNDIKIKTKHLLMIGVVLIAFVSIVSYVTAGRTGEEVSSEGSATAFLNYLTGPVTAFDYAIHSNYIERMGGYTWGRLSFSALEGWIKYASEAFGVPYETALERLTMFKQGERIFISPHGTWNALYTNQLFSWLDGGVFGCFFFPFIFGIGVRYFFNLYNKYHNWQFFVLMASFFQLCMESTIDFRFISPFTLLAFGFIYVLGIRNANVV